MTKNDVMPTNLARLKELTPEEVIDMSTHEFIELLIDYNIVQTRQDIRLIILEALNHMAANDDAFPVHYYKDNEQMPEESKVVNCECLTDDYIANNFS